MNNFLSIFDTNNDDSMSNTKPRVSFRLTSNLTPVAGHVGASYKGCLLIWGGYFYANNRLGNREPDALYVYPYALTNNFNVWLRIECTSTVPMKPNCGASGLIHNDDLYIFGGTTTVTEGFARSRSLPASTLYKFDLKTGIINFIDIPDDQKIPTPRDKTASWVVGNRLYYFGGYGIRLSRLDKPDAYLFDADDYKEENGAGRNVWNNQLLEFDVDKCKWSLVQKLGDVPSQRAAPGAAYVPDLHSVFLFGGRDESSRLNDLYRLDMFFMQWYKIEVEGEKPMGRSWSTFTFVPDKQMLVVQGGFSIDDRPLDDLWNLDLSELYDREKCQNGTATVKWVCVRKPRPYNRDDSDDDEDEVEEDFDFRRFWHTANFISDAILFYGGMRQNPSDSGPCLNTLSIQQYAPSSLFNICQRNLSRSSLLTNLPNYISPLNIKRKLSLLEELRRFKSRKDSYYLNECNRHCPSLYKLSLAEIFNVLDMNVN